MHIYCITVSPDNLTLVSGSLNSTAVVCDIRSGRVLRRLEGHRGGLRSVAYSPDGLLVATGSRDCSVKIWEASTGACRLSLDLSETVYNIVFSIDGSRLAVSTLTTNFLYDLRSRTPRPLREGPTRYDGRARGARAMSLQGDRVIARNAKKAEIWSAVTGEQLLELTEHAENILSVAFSPDGAEVAIAADDRTVVVYDSWTGQRRQVHEMSLGAHSVAYSPEGDLIAMGDYSGRIRVCDAKSGTFVADFERRIGPISGHELQFTADPRSLLSRSDSNATIHMWNIRDVMRIR